MGPHKNRIIILLVLSFGYLWGCSGIRVGQDYDLLGDFSSLKTYAWQTERQPQTGDIRVDTTLIDARMRSAVDRSLAKKGYRKVEGKLPDFHVAYTYQISRRIESDSVGFGFGFGGGGSGRYGGIGVDTGSSVREYDEGLWVIDLFDAASGKLIWRGTGTARVESHPKPADAEKQVNAVVEKIFSQFPPQPE